MEWNYRELDYNRIAGERVEDNRFLFTLVTIASFIEITSDVYRRNLTLFYREFPQIVNWLEERWEAEELQHGEALKSYVERVWDQFDWEEGYRRFREYYLPLCKVENLQPSPEREMLARMVVETGTSTFYKGLSSYAKELGEPFLAELADLIS
ncbi:MAG: ferritin-like domain-containing protein, partial [Epsilonproteobacteria bacterium]|nr:hypothetical protein [Campylobacterota bacterium]NPA56468.1 ferritin-like domain-containing protein [Campylobacterota bacterium]